MSLRQNQHYSTVTHHFEFRFMPLWTKLLIDYPMGICLCVMVPLFYSVTFQMCKRLNLVIYFLHAVRSSSEFCTRGLTHAVAFEWSHGCQMLLSKKSKLSQWLSGISINLEVFKKSFGTHPFHSEEPVIETISKCYIFFQNQAALSLYKCTMETCIVIHEL